MRSDWSTGSVAELEAAGILLVQDGNHGEYRPRREELVPDGTPHIRAADISDTGIIDFGGAQRINDVALARIRKGVGSGGDVLLTHKGTVGRVARAPTDAPHFVCSPQTTFWRSLDPDRLDQTFLFAYLRSPAFAAQLLSRMHDTDMAPYVSLTAQRSFVVPLPPIAQQRNIASLLATLDDKLDSNRRLARLLEQTVAALFRGRYVDFVETPEFHINEHPLREVTLMIQRGRAPSYCEEGGTLVINQKCVRDGKIDFDKARRHDSAARPVAEERILLLDDVLVNSTGVGTLGRIASVRWVPEPATVDSHVTIVRADPNVVVPAYLARELATSQAEIEALAEGSTGQTELSRSRLAQLAVQEEFARVSKPAMAQVATCEREVLILAAIRDLLLPKLVSGQICVPEIADPAEVIEPATEASTASL